MSKKVSAGFLCYASFPVEGQVDQWEIRYLIGYPGGPHYYVYNDGLPTVKKPDEHNWSILKGKQEPGEELFETACREFEEETGVEVDTFSDKTQMFTNLGSVTYKNGKEVYAWAVRLYVHPRILESNKTSCEYPKDSGKIVVYQEVNEFKWANRKEAKKLLNKHQYEFVEKIEQMFGKQARKVRGLEIL